MAFDVSAYEDYTNQESTDLITRAQFTGILAALPGINIQTGVKSKQQLKKFDTDVVLADGTSCGFSAAGNDTFTKRDIETGAIRINKKWCLEDLEAKATQLLLSRGAQYDESDLPGAIVDLIMKKIAKANATSDWQNLTTDLYTGLATIIKGATGVVNGNVDNLTSMPTGTALITALQKFINKIPVEVYGEDDCGIFMGVDNFRELVTALVNANNFHFTGDGEAYKSKRLVFPGTDIVIYGDNGLNGTNEWYAFQESNIWMGVDMENDEEKFKIWFSDDDDEVKLKTRYRRGWQVGNPEEITRFNLSGS